MKHLNTFDSFRWLGLQVEFSQVNNPGQVLLPESRRTMRYLRKKKKEV